MVKRQGVIGGSSEGLLGFCGVFLRGCSKAAGSAQGGVREVGNGSEHGKPLGGCGRGGWRWKVWRAGMRKRRGGMVSTWNG